MTGHLLRFRVANHRSIRDEIELTLIASKPAAKQFKNKSRFFLAPAIKESLSTAAVVYGANGSGKTNLFTALAFMQHAVRNSYRSWSPNSGVPVEPFMQDSQPSAATYSVELLLNQVRYEYGFTANKHQILNEWINAWPNGKKQQWLLREGDNFQFGEKLTGHNKAMKVLTRNNALYLSAAAQNNHEQLAPLFNWFTQHLNVLFLTGGGFPRGIDSWWHQFIDQRHAGPTRKQVLALLQAADLGITDFRVKEVEIDLPEDLRKALSRALGNDAKIRDINKTLALEFKHGDVWLTENTESTGTKHLIGLLPAILSAQANGGVLCIDELNAMHPMITVELLRLFQDFSHNPNHAQLLFNTHDVTLLGTSLSPSPPLSRDQVWFTEKDDSGATQLASLHDYKVRDNENLERGYFQGRYGGVPYPMFDQLRGLRVAKGN